MRCADIGLERELDSGVLRWALDHGRILLTHDTDFGELATLRNEPAYGIVLLRPGHGDTAVTIRQLATALDLEAPEEGPWMLTVDLRDGQPRARLRDR